MSAPMDSFVESAQAFLEGLGDRVRNAIDFNMTRNQFLRLVLFAIVYFNIIRPWMLKYAEKEGEKQLGAMEQRDKEKKDKEQQEANVNKLRTGKTATAEEDETTTASATGSQPTKATPDQRAQQKLSKKAEAEFMTAEDIRARNLENWDEDQDFLKNFAKASDRSHA